MIAAYLIVIITNCSGGNCQIVREYPMETMEQCFKSSDASKVDVAKGGDAEGSVAIFCAREKL